MSTIETILVTGGAGFIGSHFIRYCLKNYDTISIINLDKLTYAGNLDNLKEINDYENYHFAQGDITNRKLVESLFEKYDIDKVINFAAESHVDRSIENPNLFFETNILGTQVLLDVSKKYWKKSKQEVRKKDMNQASTSDSESLRSEVLNQEYHSGVKFLQVSTDEVYGDMEGKSQSKEDDNLLPNSPYAASKPGADLLVKSYHKTYGLPVVITRCSNNYGPNQFPEKLIPLMTQFALEDKKLPIYGNGNQIRDWLYVEDHCDALYKVLFHGRNGEIYNISGDNEQTNLTIVQMILKSLGKSEDLIQHVTDRPGHDKRYAMDHSEMTSELEWVPKVEFEEGMRKTIEWYRSNLEWVDKSLSHDSFEKSQETLAFQTARR